MSDTKDTDLKAFEEWRYDKTNIDGTSIDRVVAEITWLACCEYKDREYGALKLAANHNVKYCEAMEKQAKDLQSQLSSALTRVKELEANQIKGRCKDCAYNQDCEIIMRFRADFSADGISYCSTFEPKYVVNGLPRPESSSEDKKENICPKCGREMLHECSDYEMWWECDCGYTLTTETNTGEH